MYLKKCLEIAGLNLGQMENKKSDSDSDDSDD